jgi:hypothetical protein
MITTKLKFMVWSPEHSDEDESMTVDAFSADDAAETWAERFDADGDYIIVGGESIICMVKPIGDGHTGRNSHEIKYFRVGGETVNRYSADEV